MDFIRERTTLQMLKTHSAQLLLDDVAHDVPAFEGENLEEREHSIANVVEVEVARIGPVQTKQ